MLIRNTFVVAAVAAFIALGSASAANADDSYPPVPPGSPSLAGSVAVGECHSDAPWIDYDIDLTGAEGEALASAASLSITDGSNSVTLPLGQLSNGHLEGRVLWPGAAVDASGAPTQWPGWVQENGTWVDTGANYGWTRGTVTATLTAGASLSVPLVYPVETPNCTTPAIELPFTPSGTSDDASVIELAFTGSNAPITAVALGGTAIALLGVGIVVGRRFARR